MSNKILSSIAFALLASQILAQYNPWANPNFNPYNYRNKQSNFHKSELLERYQRNPPKYPLNDQQVKQLQQELKNMPDNPWPFKPQTCDPHYNMPQEYLNKNELTIPPLYSHGETGVKMDENTPGVINKYLNQTYAGYIVFHRRTGGSSIGGECGLGIEYVILFFF
jgi:hypothetical protein